jgi:hypothetical protein
LQSSVAPLFSAASPFRRQVIFSSRLCQTKDKTPRRTGGAPMRAQHIATVMCDATAFDAPLSEPRRAAFRAVVNIIRRTRRRGCPVSIYMAEPWLSWREFRTNNSQPSSLIHSLILLPNNVRFTAASTVRRVLCAPPMPSITQNFGLLFRHCSYVCNSATNVEEHQVRYILLQVGAYK